MLVVLLLLIVAGALMLYAVIHEANKQGEK